MHISPYEESKRKAREELLGRIMARAKTLVDEAVAALAKQGVAVTVDVRDEGIALKLNEFSSIFDHFSVFAAKKDYKLNGDLRVSFTDADGKGVNRLVGKAFTGETLATMITDHIAKKKARNERRQQAADTQAAQAAFLKKVCADNGLSEYTSVIQGGAGEMVGVRLYVNETQAKQIVDFARSIGIKLS